MSSQEIKTVTLFFRDPRQGNYSIEQIFQSISQEMKSTFNVRLFYVDSSKGLIANILNARKSQGDVNHITGDVNWLIYGLDRRRSIITIHDLGHFESTLKGWKRLIFKKIWLEWPLKRARSITSISNFTKDRLLYHFPYLQGKINVIYNPLPIVYRDSNSVSRSLSTTPKILQVGAMENKNIERLIAAVTDIHCELILLRDYDNILQKLLNRLKIKHKFLSNLNQEDVMRLYRGADILYFASTYEGFGMPIIEAQSQGCVVLTSNLASMPEVSGNGACLVDPYNIDSINDGLVKVISNEGYRLKLITNGYLNLKRFDIEGIKQKYLNLYKQIICEGEGKG
ncbi:MAG: glycosyltransferase family 1 protein [Fulvivirga sp.]|uniref:glycosyltransferase family 4 protein n=1 Tax=Fulvivirga sp. TaxID=1931237 RepID=UPI0032EF14E0